MVRRVSREWSRRQLSPVEFAKVIVARLNAQVVDLLQVGSGPGPFGSSRGYIPGVSELLPGRAVKDEVFNGFEFSTEMAAEQVWVMAKPELVALLGASAKDEVGDGCVPVASVPDGGSDVLEGGEPSPHV